MIEDAVGIAGKLLGLVLDLVPAEHARQLLDEAALTRSDAIVAAAFAAKFHTDTEPPPKPDE